MCETTTERKVKGLQSDNGGEFMSGAFQAYLREKGIVHYTSVPYTPPQNGVIERANRTLTEGARTMLHNANLLKSFWYFAVAAKAYLLNRTPTRANNGITPFERWFNIAPKLSHLRIFGSPVSVAVAKEKRVKWDVKSHLCYMVGYDRYDGGYIVWDPVAKREIKACDVIFHEHAMVPAVPRRFGAVEMEKEVEKVAEPPADDIQVKTEDVTVPPQPRITIRLPGRLAAPPASNANPVEPTAEPAPAERGVPFLDTVPDFPIHSSRSGIQRLGIASENASFAAEMPEVDVALSAATGEPLTLVEALAMEGEEGKMWNEAAQREWDNLAAHHVYDWVDPGKESVITCGTVLKKKYVDGKVSQYKVRAVAHGFRQIPGVHYNNTYAPVVRFESLRTMMAIGAIKDVSVRQFDIKSAYLHSRMKERVLMHPPRGFPIPEDKRGQVWLMRVSLYGTKQGGADWHEMLDDFMVKENGWTNCPNDEAVYYRVWDNGDWAWVSYWVDDANSVGIEGRLLDLEEKIAKRFGVSSVGDASWMLGMTVERDRAKKTISLGQEAYIDTLLERFGLENAHPVSTPLPVGIELNKSQCPKTDEEKAAAADLRYSELVGSLMYAALATRPDISSAVATLSKFMSNPAPVHYEAGLRVLRYLKGTKDGKLTLGGWAEITAYSDSNWGGDRDNRRSTGGYVFCIGAGAVSWSAKQQPTPALSSLEAEYMALTQATKEALWLKRFMGDLGIHIPSVKLFGDNQGSLALATNRVFHARSKHIDIQYHFIRHHVKSGEIILKYLPTAYMVADIMTKPLPLEKHCTHTRSMGVTSAGLGQ
jgi:hypothetical protein